MEKLNQKCGFSTEAENLLNYVLTPKYQEVSSIETAAVAEWLRVWDTLTMIEATVCRRS